MPSKFVATLVAVALACLLLGAAMPLWTTPADIDYAVAVEPADDGELHHGFTYEESDVVAYENLSREAQQAFDRARAASTGRYVVDDENRTAPDLFYETDNVAVGHGVYPVRYEGATYSLHAERLGGGIDVAALVQLYLLKPVLLATGAVTGLTAGYYFARE
jgi:hypothetical protein